MAQVPVVNLGRLDALGVSLRSVNMLRYLLGHPEYSFSPAEAAELCEAFDGALATLHEESVGSVNWSADEVTAALAAEIVESRLLGETDRKRLRDQAVSMAKTLFDSNRHA